jgi:hypothetical protein
MVRLTNEEYEALAKEAEEPPPIYPVNQGICRKLRNRRLLVNCFLPNMPALFVQKRTQWQYCRPR